MLRFPANLFAYLILLVSTVPAFCDGGHHHALTSAEIGSVDFKTTCAKSVTSDFNHAVALLHSFQYEEAEQAFHAIASKDPQCAMAHWGVAMTHYHGLWENGDPKASKAAIVEAEAIAARGKTSAREIAYIDAFGALFKGDVSDNGLNAQAFERGMEKVQATYPEDKEAAIFHALTLAITAPKTDKTYANQRKCGEILEPLFAQLPHHPGIAHYLIHCYDNPVLATQGLAAARAYAKIAPASPHANHMPSHIFTRVGSWQESIQSNIRSADIAAKAEAISRNGEARDQRLHAMDYMEYAYLQTGQVSKAASVLAEMNSLQAEKGLTLTGNYATAAIPARFAMELGRWQEASDLKVDKTFVPWAQAISWMAIGTGSARSGQRAKAAEAEKNLQRLRDATMAQQNKYWADQIEVQRREVKAWIAEEDGHHREAIEQMRSAADLEDSMEKSPVTPGAVVPAREMLAQLLSKNDPKNALAEYEAVLKVAPNRFNATYGAAMAARSAGENKVASEMLHSLGTFTVGQEREELKAVKMARAGN